MQASNNTAIAKIYEEDDSEETEYAPTKVGALASLARVSLPSYTDTSDLQAFRDWSDAASRTQKTESGIQLRPAPAIPPPPKPEFRKLELLRAEITHTTTSLTPVPVAGPPPTFELLALAARRTPPPPKVTLPRPELPSATLRRSQIQVPVIYDNDEDDWIPTLKYRPGEPSDEGQVAQPKRESQLPPPPASRSSTLLPPPPRAHARSSAAIKTASGVVAVVPAGTPRRTESGVQAIPTSLVQALLTREIRKGRSTRSPDARIVFGPARPPTPLQVTTQKLAAAAAAPIATPSEPEPERELVPAPGAAVAARKPASRPPPIAAPPTLRLAPAKVTVLKPSRPAPSPARAPSPLSDEVEEVAPVPAADATDVVRVERDPFASRPRSRDARDDGKSHLRFVLGMMFLFVCMAALLWLGAPFWRGLLSPLL
jgi:hypothetical protein